MNLTTQCAGVVFPFRYILSLQNGPHHMISWCLIAFRAKHTSPHDVMACRCCPGMAVSEENGPHHTIWWCCVSVLIWPCHCKTDLVMASCCCLDMAMSVYAKGVTSRCERDGLNTLVMSSSVNFLEIISPIDWWWFNYYWYFYFTHSEKIL